jgi:hypothetical protein
MSPVLLDFQLIDTFGLRNLPQFFVETVKARRVLTSARVVGSRAGECLLEY